MLRYKLDIEAFYWQIFLCNVIIFHSAFFKISAESLLQIIHDKFR